MMEIWIILYILTIITALIGVFIFSQKKLRVRVNLKEVWQLFWIVILLRIFDVISTIYFTNKLGIEYEGNLIAKAFMSQFGIIPGILLIFILSIPMMFFWYVLVNYIFKNQKLGWKTFRIIVIIISVIIPIINFLA
jgi:hypothetical protein